MQRPLYQALAGLVGAYLRCVNDETRQEWADKHRAAIWAMVRAHLPHGAGFDSGTDIDLDASTDEKLVFTTSYHHMNENGFYDGWTEHKVTVRPSLAAGFVLRISGRDRNDFKDYASEVFSHALLTEVDEHGGKVQATG
jgi:hypothetical protein